MTIVEVLRAARAKITDPKHWTRHVNARDADGEPISPSDPSAVCWCSYGAIAAVDPEDDAGTNACDFLHDAAREKTGHWGVSALNDDGEHSDVLSMFDRAIELAESH